MSCSLKILTRPAPVLVYIHHVVRYTLHVLRVREQTLGSPGELSGNATAISVEMMLSNKVGLIILLLTVLVICSLLIGFEEKNTDILKNETADVQWKKPDLKWKIALLKNETTDVDVDAVVDFHNNATTVAFVVTITGCGGDFAVFDGAAILSYSIHQNSIHGPNGGRYNYDLYAFHHPNALECALPLEKLGFIVQERDTPVAIAEIRNSHLQNHIQIWGCCGERELIKFEAFTLTQYPAVVLLDADTLVLKPLDQLFDSFVDATTVLDPDITMYVGKPASFGMNTNVTIPDRIDLLYTSDYPIVEASRIFKPTQGGFVVLRPNLTVYNDIIEIVREGDYRFDGSGWGGLTGMFWGGMFFVLLC